MCNVWRHKKHLTDILLKRGAGGHLITCSHPLCACSTYVMWCATVFTACVHNTGFSAGHCVFNISRFASTWCYVSGAFVGSSTRCGVNAFDMSLTCNLCTVVVSVRWR